MKDKIVELLADMLKGQDRLTDEVSKIGKGQDRLTVEVTKMKGEIVKQLNLNTSENSRAILKHEKRIAKLESIVLK